MASEYDHLYKLIIVGDAGVGKTSFISYYTDRRLDFNTCTGFDFKVKTINLDGEVVKLQLWDTPGHARAYPIPGAYYRTARGIFLAYDVTDKKSFDSIPYWKQEIEKHASADVNVVLLGCKSDLASQRKVPYDQGKALADAFDMQFIESSAILPINIDAAVEMLTRQVSLAWIPVVFTLVSVVVEPCGHLALSIATIGGEMMQVRIAEGNATVAAAISSIRVARGAKHVKLVSTDGTMLAPEELLPGVADQTSGSRCIVQ